jgi:hypothetical protein
MANALYIHSTKSAALHAPVAGARTFVPRDAQEAGMNLDALAVRECRC